MKDRPTAIFAGNDEMAVGVYSAAQKARLRIPQDLSVVGYDDTPIVSRLWPPMTSVRFPIREVGCNIAKLLLSSDKLCDREQAPQAQTIDLDLIIRASTAPPVN